MRWLTFTGLVADIIGVFILAWPIMFASDDDIEEATATMWAGTKEQNLKQPAAQALMRERKSTWWGVGFIVGGFALQAVAAWPR